MKIALISSWNACCGVSTHAELVAEALQRSGHKLTILAPTSYEDDNTKLIHAPDQPNVTRCYSFLRYGDRATDTGLLDSLYLDADPLLGDGFDLVMVEKPTSTPLGRLAEALRRTGDTGRLVAILHEGTAPLNPYLGRLDWDAAAIFDERYRPLFKGVIPGHRVHVVPFPCHPVERRDKGQARERLGFPRDAEVVFSYGSLRGYGPVIDAVTRLGEEQGKLILLLMAGDPRTYTQLRTRLGGNPACRILFGRPPTGALYDYLCASDALILHKGHPPHVAVSSSAHLCMGSLTPILCSDTAHFEMHGGELIKYREMGGLMEGLRWVLDGGATEVALEAQGYVEAHRADAVAERLTEL